MTALQELAKYNRKAALIYQREIRLLIKRDRIPASKYIDDIDYAEALIDSFHWGSTRQGSNFWSAVYNDIYTELCEY